MAIINGIQLLHKRYADWSGKTLQAGELGLNLTTLEVRIGTAANQSWENASVVSCKVEIQGTGKHIVGASYENGKLIITKGTVNYNDLADLPELKFDAEGTAAAAVSAHNSAEDAHADIRKGVSDNAGAIATEKQRAEGKEGELAQAIADEKARAEKKEGELQEAVNAKVAQSDYNTKVGELVAEDARIAGLVAAEAKTRGEEITRVEGLISTEKGRIDTLVNTTVPALEGRVKNNEDAIAALEGIAASGLSRKIVTALPDVNSAEAKENVIYMILRADNVGAESGDIYDEYLLMGEEGNKRFELLGNTAVDLTDYYVKSEVYTKEEANTAITNAVNPVSQAVSKEVTDRENAVKGVQDQLDELKGENGYKKEITDAVKVEKDRAELAEQGLDGRIDAIEALQLQAGSTYATKVELQGVSKAVEDEASRANTEEKRIVGLVNGLDTRMGTAEGKISTLEGQAAAVAGQIEAAVADEAAIRLEKDNALEGRIANLEKVEYTGDNAIIEVSEANVISHKKSGVAESENFGFYAFKVDEYGHVTAAQLITTLDGNAE